MAIQPLSDGFVYIEYDDYDHALHRPVDLREKEGEFVLEKGKDDQQHPIPNLAKEGDPILQETEEAYLKKIDSLKGDILPLSSQQISDVWNNLFLSIPGRRSLLEGDKEVKINLQAELDLPRVHWLKINNKTIFNKTKGSLDPLGDIITGLAPLVEGAFAMNRFLNCMTQMTLARANAILLLRYSNPQLDIHATTSSFHYINVTTEPGIIKVVNTYSFLLQKIMTQEAIRYTKIQKVFVIHVKEIQDGSAKLSRAYDLVYPFYKTQLEALSAEMELPKK